MRWIERARKSRQRWQQPLLLFAIVALIAGCAISLHELDLRWSDVNWGPLLVIAAVVIPLSIIYSALNMMLMGRAVKVPIGMIYGLRVSVFAQVAELLPIPGGAIVRTAALMRAGSSTGKSAEIVLAFSLLWIACGGTAAGLALAEVGWSAQAFASICGLGVLIICVWLTVRFGVSLAVAATLLRALGVALVAWRFALAFAVIGATLSWIDAGAFAFAAILGTASSLIPGGLGVSEGLAALIAKPGGVDPATAFLAAALSRLVGLAINMLLALALTLFRGRSSQGSAHA